jgi:uncharacterized protein (DUF2342 family)
LRPAINSVSETPLTSPRLWAASLSVASAAQLASRFGQVAQQIINKFDPFLEREPVNIELNFLNGCHATIPMGYPS